MNIYQTKRVGLIFHEASGFPFEENALQWHVTFTSI